MNKKTTLLALAAISILTGIGVPQLNAEGPIICRQTLSKSEQKALYALAKKFLSSKTDTPESGLKISPLGIIIPGKKSLSLVSFTGEDFSDHSSRIDRCYVATYDAMKKTISVVNRNFQSDGSEDSTPCVSTEIFGIKKIDGGAAWITYNSSYINPQTNQESGESILEIYNLNLDTGVACYDNKVTEEINLVLDKPDETKLNYLLASKKLISSNQCSQ